MAESAVSFLLDQLSVWLGEQRQLLGGFEREVEYIRDEMGQMKEFLRVADAKEESNPSLKEWVRQLREISYDVEDVLDKYMLRFGQHRETIGFRGRIKKVNASIKNLRARRQIASEIQAIKYRLENVSRSQQRYRDMCVVMDQGSSSIIPKNEWYDGRGDALFLEEADVVGIEEPKKHLLEWIRSMDDGLEVISIVGMGGLGKTTLVKKVFDDESVKRRFNRHVWIVVSDYKDVKHLLVNLIKKLVCETKESPPQGLEDMTLDEMRNFIYESLEKEKYIIVLDDVWHISTWEAVRFALPRRDTQGCIIITTRFISIGNAACSETSHVYNLKPLLVAESMELFYKKAFPRNTCPPNYLREFAENIVKRCEGLPLAIVVIGGLLATKNNRPEEWEKFNKSITHELDEGGSLKRLWKLLSLSYNDLPYHLKYCFLYLSIFPEGGLLYKERIIKLWTAEGFVQSKRDKIMEEVADDYFNELLSRSLIQVAERYSGGNEWAFRIHGLVRDYITLKSSEQDIVTIYNEGVMQWPNKIRRLAVQKFINFSMDANNFEYLRSLLLLCDEDSVSGQIKELVSRCRLLKVLDLRGAPLESIPDEVFKLYHLKYLCLSNTMVKLVPSSIKNLENLETLDLSNSNVTELPIEILDLHKLRHLSVYKRKKGFTFHNRQGFKVPCGIGDCLLSLQELFSIDADEDDGIKIVREIGKLTQLRTLGIAKLRSEDGMDLCSSIARLTNLRTLSIHSIKEGEKLDLDYSLSCVSLPFLRRLELIGYLEKIPQWIPSLNGLTILCLGWCRLREDPLNSLQVLPNLAYLEIHGADVEGLSFKAHGFQKLIKLKLLKLKCMKWVIVEKGSMPFLENWVFGDCELLIELPRGIEHLTNLQLLHFSKMADEFVERVAEQKRNEGDNWRLAHVPNFHFFLKMKDGTWKRLQV